MELREISVFKQDCLVNGEWLKSDTRIDVVNPSTGRVIAAVPKLGCAETNQAIEYANAALKEWKLETAATRGAYLKRWHALILQHIDDLAYIMTCEQGKPLAEAKGEINYAASYVEWFAEEAMRIQGEVLPAALPNTRILVTREPVGVCVAITPWNFPAAMITRKVAPALAAGCTIIVKPASQTPLTALALGELAVQAGIPKGVLQIITGKASEVGDAMCANPIVRKLSFTGSTDIGAQLMAKCAPDVKKLSLELGGNAPFIVFDDADVEHAVEQLIKAKFRNAGQTCISPNRIYVHKAIKCKFECFLVDAVSRLKVGDGLAADTTVGPLIDAAAVLKVEQHIADAVSSGARILVGGHRLEQGDNWFQPTVLTDVSADAACACEETFGPLVPIISFSTEQEVIRLANDTPFGLAAYFFSENHYRVQRVVEQIEAGMVGINTGVISAANAPFGGIKASGLGREGAHIGLEEYLEMKYQCYGIKAE